MFTSSWRVVLYETANLPEGARARVVQRVVDAVEARHVQDRRPWTSGETRRAVKRAIAAVAAAEAAQARARAHARRRVAVTPAGDGMAWLSGYIRDVDAHRIYNRLTAAAAAAAADDPSDGRSTDEHRADALVAALLNHPHPTPAPEADTATTPPTPAGAAAGTATTPPTTPRSTMPGRSVALCFVKLFPAVSSLVFLPGWLGFRPFRRQGVGVIS